MLCSEPALTCIDIARYIKHKALTLLPPCDSAELTAAFTLETKQSAVQDSEAGRVQHDANTSKSQRIGGATARARTGTAAGAVLGTTVEPHGATMRRHE